MAQAYDTSNRRTLLGLPHFVHNLEPNRVYEVPGKGIQFRRHNKELQYKPSAASYWYSWPADRVTDTTGCCSACSVHLDGTPPIPAFFIFLEYLCDWMGVNCIQTSVMSYEESHIGILTGLDYVEAYRHSATRCSYEVNDGVEVIQYYKVFPARTGYPDDIGEEYGEDFLDGQLDGSNADY